jgi:hypothetical protein
VAVQFPEPFERVAVHRFTEPELVVKDTLPLGVPKPAVTVAA